MLRLSSHCSDWVGLSCLAVLLMVVAHTSGQLQCPNRQVEFFPNGSVNFDPLHSGNGMVDATFDTGPARGWYGLAAGFVNVVRPGDLPYGMCARTHALLHTHTCT